MTDLRTDPSTFAHKWIDIHELSANVVSPDQIEPTYRSIQIILRSVRCERCSKHISIYHQEHPIDSYLQKDRLTGLFDYYYEFHNAVNLRLGKPHMNYKSALQMYFESPETSPCDTFCGVD